MSTNRNIKKWVCNCGRMQDKPLSNEPALWICNKCSESIGTNVISWLELNNTNYLRRLIVKDKDKFWQYPTPLYGEYANNYVDDYIGTDKRLKELIKQVEFDQSKLTIDLNQQSNKYIKSYITNFQKKGKPDGYLSDRGETIFAWIIIVGIVGGIFVKVFGIGESSYSGSDHDNPMHEGR